MISRKKATAGAAHVVDLGTGCGLLAVMAATAGADSVVACDLHEGLTNIARQVITSFQVSATSVHVLGAFVWAVPRVLQSV